MFGKHPMFGPIERPLYTWTICARWIPREAQQVQQVQHDGRFFADLCEVTSDCKSSSERWKKDLAISWPIDQLTNVSSGCGWSQPGGICTILILAGEPVMRSPFSRLRPEECQTKLKSSSKSVKLLSRRGGLWLKRWLSHVWNGNGMKCWNVGQDGWCTYKQMLRKRPWALFFSLRAPCLMNIA